MVEDHAGLSNGRIDEDAFLDQCERAWREREAMMLHELDRFDEGLLYCLFDTPDRVQHMFWRFREPDHPAHRGQGVPAEMAGVVEDQYRRADAIVGQRARARRRPDPGDRAQRPRLRLASAAAFTSTPGSTSRACSHLREGASPGDEAGEFPACVDWSRTRAYALGPGRDLPEPRGTRRRRGSSSPTRPRH